MDILNRLTLFSRKGKILLLLLLVVVLFTGYHYSHWFVPVEFKDYGEWLAEKPRSLGEIQRYSDALVDAYEWDTFGGSTPEETLALWVEAVRAGDLEKASLYFLVDAQVDSLEGMKISKENNVLSRIISDIEDGGVMSVSEYPSARFDTSTSAEAQESGRPGFELEFIKNPYTDVWKLEEF